MLESKDLLLSVRGSLALQEKEKYSNHISWAGKALNITVAHYHKLLVHWKKIAQFH